MADGWLHYFPPGSLDARSDLHRFSAEWFAQALERLGEKPLHPAEPHQALVIRLLCLPTWRAACSVRVEARGLSWWLVGRELDGEEAGLALGELARREDRRLSGAEASQVAELWEYLRFWSLAVASDEDVCDGTTYVLEAAERGRYRVAHRDDPEWGIPSASSATCWPVWQVSPLGSKAERTWYFSRPWPRVPSGGSNPLPATLRLTTGPSVETVRLEEGRLLPIEQRQILVARLRVAGLVFGQDATHPGQGCLVPMRHQLWQGLERVRELGQLPTVSAQGEVTSLHEGAVQNAEQPGLKGGRCELGHGILLSGHDLNLGER